MKSALTAALVLIALGFAAGLFAGELQGPRISVDEPLFDFGTVRAGDRPEHVFTIRNTGDEVLLIEQVLPG